MKQWFLACLLSIVMLLGDSPQAFAVEMEVTDIGGIEVSYWVPMGASAKTPVITIANKKARL